MIIPNIWKNKKCSKPPTRRWRYYIGYSYMFKLHQSASECGIPKKIALNWWNVSHPGNQWLRLDKSEEILALFQNAPQVDGGLAKSSNMVLPDHRRKPPVINHLKRCQISMSHRIHGAAIYGNMDPINIPPMLAYIPAPWILWVLDFLHHSRNTNSGRPSFGSDANARLERVAETVAPRDVSKRKTA